VTRDVHCILDTSIVAAWFFTDEPQRDDALAVRSELRQKPADFAVPPLFHAELVHVLADKSGSDQRFVSSALDLVVRLGLRTVPLSEAALRRTVDWTCRGLSGYDATFVALAEDLDGYWLTADRRAARTAHPVARLLGS
jgi:predicted nucleic acid-binding protein